MWLLNFDDSVNSGEHTRTYSHWVVNDCGLWLVAWNVQVHDLEIEKIVECNDENGKREPCARTSYDEEELFFLHGICVRTISSNTDKRIEGDSRSLYTIVLNHYCLQGEYLLQLKLVRIALTLGRRMSVYVLGCFSSLHTLHTPYSSAAICPGVCRYLLRYRLTTRRHCEHVAYLY